jgi:hypothetical protein
VILHHKRSKNTAPPAIIAKLQALLAKGIMSEAEALYLMVEVRKLLEHHNAKKQYEYLTFHCDWALHAALEGAATQKILKQFDAATIHLKAGIELHDLPGPLRMEIERISKMKYFEGQFEKFLTANHLTPLEQTRSDGWIHFVHLYAKIVEDCPLVMTAKNKSATIASVTLKLDLAKPSKELEGEILFRVRWIIKDKNGLSGVIDIYNSFSENPQGRHEDYPRVDGG